MNKEVEEFSQMINEILLKPYETKNTPLTSIEPTKPKNDHTMNSTEQAFIKGNERKGELISILKRFRLKQRGEVSLLTYPILI